MQQIKQYCYVTINYMGLVKKYIHIPATFQLILSEV